MDFSIPDLQSYAANVAESNGIPPDLFLAQIGQESSWNPYAQNGNALGIAQFMPATASQFNLNPLDPYASLDAAGQYDSQLLNQCGGDFACMLQKYGTTAGVGQNVLAKFAPWTGGTGSNSGGSNSSGSNSSGGFFSSFGNLFASYASRVAGIVLGIVLIAGAIYIYHDSR